MADGRVTRIRYDIKQQSSATYPSVFARQQLFNDGQISDWTRDRNRYLARCCRKVAIHVFVASLNFASEGSGPV
jgi:hypothetical protein